MAGNLSHGMNIEEVRALGQYLQTQAGDHIQQLISQIDAKVNGAGWQGPDAEMFKNQWWPEKRTMLDQMKTALHEFGNSAINNANAQEQASAG